MLSLIQNKGFNREKVETLKKTLQSLVGSHRIRPWENVHEIILSTAGSDNEVTSQIFLQF